MAVARARMHELLKLQASLFNHSFNPSNARTGNSVLRERLIGPAVASYYPKRPVSIKDIVRMFPEWETFDEAEAERIDNIAILKARGKGPPKKKRTKEESKKNKGKKK
ncbi:hypothetical protein FH972_026095 [Carpinus fangiana]|uniref:Small ribosomal subunit protein mS33 n=1 Tax=Carpinus fangiana TaxID=176857 RepID=A0A5N6L3B3_9ROSI|nr:hypothetical protein FH972_026095 [Carpinus fangiana]